MKLWSVFMDDQAILAKCQTSLLNKVIKSLLWQIMVMFGIFNSLQNNMELGSYIRLTNLHQLDLWFFKWHVFFQSFQTRIMLFIWTIILLLFPYFLCFEKRILVQQELQELPV